MIGTAQENSLSAREDVGLDDFQAGDVRGVLNSVNDGIYITDGQGKTLWVNRAFEKITGIKLESVINKNVRELMNEEIFDRSTTLEVLENQKPISIIEKLRNGKTVLLTGTPVYGEKSEIIRVVTTMRDMADLNRLQDMLARKEREKERYRQELLQLRLRQMDMDDIVIASPQMKHIMHLAMQVSHVDSTVLISGESGVGKEIVARMIHRAGQREEGPLIITNCAALPENLLESELFGYCGGSFTGALKEGKPGLFELADGGTLFLDEIGEISMNIQVKLLRAVQEREIMRIGSKKPVKVNVRMIAATNQDLKEMVEKGTFRKDLYYRLNVIPIHIPPLRDRQECISILAFHFLDKLATRLGKKFVLRPEVVRALEEYSWPGNVRELENTMERMAVLTQETEIRLEDLPAHIVDEQENYGPRLPVTIGPLNEAVERLEREMLKKAYETGKSTRKLARMLNISQSTAVRKLKKYGIRTDEEEEEERF